MVMCGKLNWRGPDHMLSDVRPGTLNPFTRMLQEAFENMMRSIMFCLPGYIVSFDSETQLAQVQCSIEKVLIGKDSSIKIPVIDNVPVHFSGSNGWYYWHEIQPGCEGLIIFSQRALDTWIETGNVSVPHDLRMFSEKDAQFIPGFRTKPGAIPNFKNEGMGMSDYSGNSFIHIKEGSIDIETTTLNINADINHTGDRDQVGNSDVNGNVSNNGTLENNGVDVGSTHTHSGSPTAPTGSVSPTGEPIP